MACGPKAQFGTMAKSFHAGLAAHHAVTSAELASAGLEGSLEVLEAPMGFLEHFGGKFPLGWKEALVGFGKNLAILEYGVIPKRHPCCASTHKCLDALLDLRQIHDFGADDVESVHTIVGNSNKRNLSYNNPQNVREAKFSMQYCIALALLQDKLRISDFSTEVIFRPELREPIPKISMEAFPLEMEKRTETSLEHEVSVRLKDGRIFGAKRAYPRGSIHDPFSSSDWNEKFADCVSGKLQRIASFELKSVLTQFETVSDLGTITQLFRFPSEYI